jgi:acyl carrier protein
MYVVDRQNNLVPQGVPGELLIGGPEGLARGYLNQPELTATLFVDDPFVPGGRVYRSGDLVRWNRDLQLEFLGRADSQVKLRGLRIELEEIESALLGHPDVSMAAVALRPDRRGEPQLVGYVTPAGEHEPSGAELRGHLLDRIPEYMVPHTWVVLDRLPLTTARKVNRAALPDPAPIGEAEVYVEPATDTERRVAAILTEVLEVEEVGAESGFFTVGGSSLSAMRVIGRVNRDFKIKFPVRQLFGNPTVRGLAGVIDELVAAKR